MEICAKCGKKIGGIVLGRGRMPPNDLAKLQAAGRAGLEPICYSCGFKMLEELRQEQENLNPPVCMRYDKIIVSTTAQIKSDEFEVIGMVSAHVAIGTGQIIDMLSSVTDFFGAESSSYSKRIARAEASCLDNLKKRASVMGATGVIGVNTTYAELMSGHGILLVCMNGTAIKNIKDK